MSEVSTAEVASPALPLSRHELRHRILPRTVIGIVLLVAALGVGIGASGVAFYAYYDHRLSQAEQRLREFDTSAGAAMTEFDSHVDAAMTELGAVARPLEDALGTPATMASLSERLAPSLWLVFTLDEAGGPAAATAFAIGSDSQRTLLLTSASAVRASTFAPGPEITVHRGPTQLTAQLWAWDDQHDLALLVIPLGDQPVLEWVSDEDTPQERGTRIYAASALGGTGASVSPGYVLDQSAMGLQHTADLGAAYRGGPIVTKEGQVIGVASLDYRPLFFDPGGVPFAPFARDACRTLVACPAEGSVSPLPPA